MNPIEFWVVYNYSNIFRSESNANEQLKKYTCILNFPVKSLILIGGKTFYQNQHHQLNQENHALTRDGTLQLRRRAIFQKISTVQNSYANGLPYFLTGVVWAFEFTEYEKKLKYALDLNCFETKFNVDYVFY